MKTLLLVFVFFFSISLSAKVMNVKTSDIKELVTLHNNAKTSYFIVLKNGKRLELYTASQLDATIKTFGLQPVFQINVKKIH